jgi:hypothetical protein
LYHLLFAIAREHQDPQASMERSQAAIATEKSSETFTGFSSKKTSQTWDERNPDQMFANAVQQYITEVDERFLRDQREQQSKQKVALNWTI